MVAGTKRDNVWKSTGTSKKHGDGSFVLIIKSGFLWVLEVTPSLCHTGLQKSWYVVGSWHDHMGEHLKICMPDPYSVLVVMGKNVYIFLKVSPCGEDGTSWTPVRYLDQIPKLWSYVSYSSPRVCSVERKFSVWNG